MASKKVQQEIVVTAPNIPIVYTDSIFMNVNEDGVTIDICQKGISQNQLQVVARVGMSKEHAKKFVKRLSEILALTATRSETTREN